MSATGTANEALAAVRNFFVNAWYGTLTQDQKDEQISSEAAALVKASGGSMSLGEATQIANSDVTNVLMSDNADPSQASVSNWAIFGKIPWYVWLGLAIGLAAFVYNKVKK